jgi:hypothetical protein
MKALIGVTCAMLALAACATTPPPGVSVNAGLVLWEKPAGGCDFETPPRDDSFAVSASRNEAGSRGRGAPAYWVYSVRNAQMQSRPEVGDLFCLTVRRGPTFGSADAVFGFEMRALSSEEFEIVPVSARISRDADRLPGRQIEARVAFAIGHHQAEASQVLSSVQFDFGRIDVGAPTVARTTSPQTLRWPAGSGRFDILRLASVVREARPGHGEDISARTLEEAFAASR